MEKHEIYDVDQAITQNIPTIKLRGQEFVLADMNTKDQIRWQRKIQLRQNEIMRKEDEIQDRLEEMRDMDEDIDLDEIEEMQEEVAEEMGGLIAMAAKLRLAKPITDEDGEWERDEMGRVQTEPISDDLAQDLTQREFQAIQAVAEKISGQSFDIEPTTAGKA